MRYGSIPFTRRLLRKPSGAERSDSDLGKQGAAVSVELTVFIQQMAGVPFLDGVAFVPKFLVDDGDPSSP